MAIPAMILVGFIALLHIYILWLEMFVWDSRGPKIFTKMPPDLFPKTAIMAANQGLYNGFLAAGLIWSLLIGDAVWSQNIALFFLACVFLAGLYGAVTVSRRILYVQSVPSGFAILLILLS